MEGKEATFNEKINCKMDIPEHIDGELSSNQFHRRVACEALFSTDE